MTKPKSRENPTSCCNESLAGAMAVGKGHAALLHCELRTGRPATLHHPSPSSSLRRGAQLQLQPFLSAHQLRRENPWNNASSILSAPFS